MSNMYVKFIGDKRKLARLAIIASVPGLEDLELDKIHNPSWVPHWNFEGVAHTVNFFCTYDVIIHPIRSTLSKPWGRKYLTAVNLIEAAGLQIVETLSLESWFKKLCTNPPGQET